MSFLSGVTAAKVNLELTTAYILTNPKKISALSHTEEAPRSFWTNLQKPVLNSKVSMFCHQRGSNQILFLGYNCN